MGKMCVAGGLSVTRAAVPEAQQVGWGQAALRELGLPLRHVRRWDSLSFHVPLGL